MPTYRDFSDQSSRPEPADRLFTSPAVEAAIAEVAGQISDPQLRRMFEQCFPNTLDTTVYYSDDENGAPDTYVVTGDIPAMWLRDSTNQVWPYLRYIASDPQLDRMVQGLIRRQARCIVSDPYANAFIDTQIVPDTPSTGLGGDTQKGIWERKYELDSLGSFLRLSYGYYEASKNTGPYDQTWVKAVARITELLHAEQVTMTRDSLAGLFRFADGSGTSHPAVRLQGYGYPGRSTGLVRTMFRPSDDETVYPYNIPANALMVVALKQTAKILKVLGEPTLANTAKHLAGRIQTGIENVGTINHRSHGQIYAYEVDGYGSAAVMDDPNAPSLLSLPYLGYIKANDVTYTATRRMILSADNPFYASGKAVWGLTSPHTGVIDHVWPIAIVMQALTTTDAHEIADCLDRLKRSHSDTYFMHESVQVDDPAIFTRPWFAWANSLFGELILNIAGEHPELLR